MLQAPGIEVNKANKDGFTPIAFATNLGTCGKTLSLT